MGASARASAVPHPTPTIGEAVRRGVVNELQIDRQEHPIGPERAHVEDARQLVVYRLEHDLPDAGVERLSRVGIHPEYRGACVAIDRLERVPRSTASDGEPLIAPIGGVY